MGQTGLPLWAARTTRCYTQLSTRQGLPSGSTVQTRRRFVRSRRTSAAWALRATQCRTRRPAGRRDQAPEDAGSPLLINALTRRRSCGDMSRNWTPSSAPAFRTFRTDTAQEIRSRTRGSLKLKRKFCTLPIGKPSAVSIKAPPALKSRSVRRVFVKMPSWPSQISV